MAHSSVGVFDVDAFFMQHLQHLSQRQSDHCFFCTAIMSESVASQKRAAAVLAKMDPKQARNNIIQSKRPLNEIPLVSWRLHLHRIEYLTSLIDMNLAIIESKVDKMKFLAEPQLEEQRNEMLVLAEETLDFMRRSRLLRDAVIDSKIQAMEHVLREHDLESLPLAAETTIADIDDKVIFYARNEDIADEMDDLRGQLTTAKQHLNSESKKKAAETPLDVHLAVVFIKNMLARAYDAEEKTRGFNQHLADPLEMWPLNTEVQLEKVIFTLKERYYRELFPKTFCATCLEEKIDGVTCNSCYTGICSQCFSDNVVHGCAERNFNDPEAVKDIALLRCCFCKKGGFPTELLESTNFTTALKQRILAFLSFSDVVYCRAPCAKACW